MGTENNATYLTLNRERRHTLMLVITAESKLSLSQQERWVHISPPTLLPRKAVAERFKRNQP